MKKKIAVLILASILALSAAACNSNSSGTTSKPESATGTTSSASSVVESKDSSEAESIDVDVKQVLNESFADVIKSGKYYISMTVDNSAAESLSSSTKTPSKITMVIATDTSDADNQKSYVDFGYSVMGMNKMIFADGKQWTLDDTNKAAYYSAVSTTNDTQSSLDTVTGGLIGSAEDIDKNLKYVSDSVENFNGKDCYAVVYEVKSDVSLADGVSMTSSSNETKNTLYFDKETKKLVGIKVNMSGVETKMVVNEITSEIPADLFTIPADYKQTDMSSMMSLASAE